MNNSPKIYFFTGCSGAGKTSIVEALAKEYDHSQVAFLHFDTIGVPSTEEMIKEYGSGPAWQRAMTFVWVNKLLSEYSDKKQIFFEGQVNLDFIIEAFAEHNYANYQIILVHCDTDKRHKRLAELRNQPDLINAEMDNWSKFLFNQAIKKNAIILDTGNQTITELIEWCKRHLN